MPDIILVDNEYMTVRYVPEGKYVHHTVHKPVTGEPFHEGLMAGSDALIRYGACKWLSDDRNQGPLSDDDAEFSNAWTARTIDGGWKYWALVVPTDAVSAGSLIPAMNTLYELGLRMMAFDNVEDAVEWLRKVERQALPDA